LSLSSQKYGFGIRDREKKPIPDPGYESRGQKGTGSRICNTAKHPLLPKKHIQLSAVDKSRNRYGTFLIKNI
jgi:hypothetical protein